MGLLQYEERIVRQAVKDQSSDNLLNLSFVDKGDRVAAVRSLEGM